MSLKDPLSKDDLDLENNVPQVTKTSFMPQVYMVINVVGSISLVFINKLVFSYPQLARIPVSFTIFHFIVTGAALYLASRPSVGLFKAKYVPWTKMIPISLSFAGFVILTNLSLAYNSVAFYQMAKVLTTPCVVLINLLMFQKQISLQIGLTLTFICMGVSLTCAGEFGTSVPGTLFAISGVIVTSLYQVWIGTKQKEFEVSSAQLLFNQAPLSAIMLLFAVPFCDTLPDLQQVPSVAWYALLLSGFGALVVNLSQFLIIGATSPVTFNGL
jgi:solute carrier family 35 protein E3